MPPPSLGLLPSHTPVEASPVLPYLLLPPAGTASQGSRTPADPVSVASVFVRTPGASHREVGAALLDNLIAARSPALLTPSAARAARSSSASGLTPRSVVSLQQPPLLSRAVDLSQVDAAILQNE